jgi:hypothetical protein
MENLPFVVGGIAAGIYALLSKSAPTPIDTSVQDHIVTQAASIAQAHIANGVPTASAIQAATQTVLQKYGTLACVKVSRAVPQTPQQPPEIVEFQTKTQDLLKKYNTNDLRTIPEWITLRDAFIPIQKAWSDAVEKATENAYAETTRQLADYKSRGWTVTPVPMYQGGPLFYWYACPPGVASPVANVMPASVFSK